MDSRRRIAVIGGGAAGFFAAVTAAEANRSSQVTVYEKSSQFLGKVKISGGGRCNVTHACFDPRDFSKRYPRGERALIGPFQSFQAQDTVQWFEQRGVRLKVEEDGRMFPITDSSQTVMDCLMNEARKLGVVLKSGLGVDAVSKRASGEFDLRLSDGSPADCHRLLLATGGCRGADGAHLAVALGHSIEPPVPSLFTFQISLPWLAGLAGLSVEHAVVSVPGTPLKQEGPLLITHAGLSGPAILRLSAWGARLLHELDYRFPLLVHWLSGVSQDEVAVRLGDVRARNGAKQIVNAPLPGLPSRLWEQLVLKSGITRETRWSGLGKSAQHQLIQSLTRCEFEVSGKSLNKDEFVTCGGVKLGEVNFKTMESKICPGLHFAGEVLDIDGITGGFNFQAAWTTGWLAGRAMASSSGG